jgi:hypothetical protein
MGENSMKMLLTLGIDPNIKDVDESLAILFAAERMEYGFVVQLIKHDSQINFCSSLNKVPFLEIIKSSKSISVE